MIPLIDGCADNFTSLPLKEKPLVEFRSGSQNGWNPSKPID